MTTWRVTRDTRRIDAPRPGLWAVRLRSGAVEVAARIFWHRTEHEPGEPENIMDRSAILSAELNGELVPLEAVWLRRGRPITEAEFKFLVADRAWAAKHAPSLPEANPREPIDPLQAPLPF